MPSFKRPSGVRCWTRAHAGDHRRGGRHAGEEQGAGEGEEGVGQGGGEQRQGQQGRHGGDAQQVAPFGGAGRYSRPVQQARRAGAGGLEGEHRARRRLVALRVRERDRDDLHRAEDRARGEESERGAGAFRGRGGGTWRSYVAGVAVPSSAGRRRSVRRSSAGRPPTSVPASGKNVPHRKAASTGPSMKHSSSAACSKEFAVCRAWSSPCGGGPSGRVTCRPCWGSWRWRRTRRTGSSRGRRSARTAAARGCRGAAKAVAGTAIAGLAVAVDEPRGPGGDQRGRRQARRRHGAGEGVRAPRTGDHDDRAHAEHAHGEAGDQIPEGEGAGAGGGEEAAVRAAVGAAGLKRGRKSTATRVSPVTVRSGKWWLVRGRVAAWVNRRRGR